MSEQKHRNRLRLLRKNFCKKQSDVSEELQINYRTLGNYEHGRTPIPSDALIKLAKYYGCSIEHILYMETDKKPITKEIEELSGEFCDKYCKYACLVDNEEQLEEICNKCPMNKLFDFLC